MSDLESFPRLVGRAPYRARRYPGLSAPVRMPPVSITRIQWHAQVEIILLKFLAARIRRKIVWSARLLQLGESWLESRRPVPLFQSKQ